VRNLKVRDLLRILRKQGCLELRQRGSHRIWQCGKCKTTIPGSDGETIPTGTMKSIERDLAPCLKPDWLRTHD
jgi:predicted RNA binding protein YcfA (HicA-like mRNA interferase family)